MSDGSRASGAFPCDLAAGYLREGDHAGSVIADPERLDGTVIFRLREVVEDYGCGLRTGHHLKAGEKLAAAAH